VDAHPLTVEGVLVEAAFLLRGVRGGIRAAVELLDAAEAEFFPCDHEVRQRALALMEKYQAGRMDLVDGLLVACAEARRTFDILTLDVRDFSIYRPLGTRRFNLHPAPT
jgi:predicted nucleic acid-binding protein